MSKELVVGLAFECERVVDQSNTAIALGSGDMEVFATPAMVALMESAAMQCVAEYLPEGSTTVGIEIKSSHVKASPIGAIIKASAELLQIEGRKLHFSVKAWDMSGIIGEGVHTRCVVDRVRFMSKLG